MMRIAVLTSSRADFGIYLPLLQKLQRDDAFSLEILAFGTHLSSFHGETVRQIIDAGFDVAHRIPAMLLSDDAESIATAMGLTTTRFAGFWGEHAAEYDLVFCLGDRYEMFAAVSAGIPFNIPFAHLHGGETTLGAIDNIFRHAITLAARYHFVVTAEHAARVAAITGSTERIYTVGALSLDKVTGMPLLSTAAFLEKWHVDLTQPTILTTFHPETVQVEQNRQYTLELIRFIKGHQQFQFLITMPNADTAGNMIRHLFFEQLQDLEHVHLVENLGAQSYFTAMKYAYLLLGNTSSGIIEAASFGRYVINLGDRQKGRSCGPNVIHVPIAAQEMESAMAAIPNPPVYTGENPYYSSNTADQIINILKEIPTHE